MPELLCTIAALILCMASASGHSCAIRRDAGRLSHSRECHGSSMGPAACGHSISAGGLRTAGRETLDCYIHWYSIAFEP